MVTTDICSIAGIADIGFFNDLLRKVDALGDSDEICRIAIQTIRYLSASRSERKESEALQVLHQRWYTSLRDLGEADYGVYDTSAYLAEMWACWSVYARKYIRSIQSPNSLPPDGIVSQIGPIGVVVDLGNGIGMSTAALAQLYPRASVYGTNRRSSYQYEIASLLGHTYGFTMVDSSDCIVRGDSAVLVFASEYFEHFVRPVDHLAEVLTSLRPSKLLIANSFGSDAIGHFDTYICDGQEMSKKEVGRAFNHELKRQGYEKVKTKLWNNRPTLWSR